LDPDVEALGIAEAEAVLETVGDLVIDTEAEAGGEHTWIA